MPTVARRRREQDILDATRALFDERGAQDAPVDEVARRLGINRALVYRHFASREELYVRTLCGYLDELAARLRDAVAGAPEEPQRALSQAFADFGLEYPAFPECALALMRRPATELRETVTEGTWVTLGRAMSGCLAVQAGLLEGHAEPDLAANVLYAQGLGLLHLARIGVGVRELAPGTGTAFPISPERVREEIVAAAERYLRPG